ncbi:hypothetical protein JCM9957A_58040 [Kineosporia succinea]
MQLGSKVAAVIFSDHPPIKVLREAVGLHGGRSMELAQRAFGQPVLESGLLDLDLAVYPPRER